MDAEQASLDQIGEDARCGGIALEVSERKPHRVTALYHSRKVRLSATNMDEISALCRSYAVEA